MTHAHVGMCYMLAWTELTSCGVGGYLNKYYCVQSIVTENDEIAVYDKAELMATAFSMQNVSFQNYSSLHRRCIGYESSWTLRGSKPSVIVLLLVFG